mgnify:CR=1 FL=1
MARSNGNASRSHAWSEGIACDKPAKSIHSHPCNRSKATSFRAQTSVPNIVLGSVHLSAVFFRLVCHSRSDASLSGLPRVEPAVGVAPPVLTSLIAVSTEWTNEFQLSVSAAWF